MAAGTKCLKQIHVFESTSSMGLTSTGLEISPTVRHTLQALYFKQSTGLNLDCFVHTEKITDIHKHDPWIIQTIQFEPRRMNSHGYFDLAF